MSNNQKKVQSLKFIKKKKSCPKKKKKEEEEEQNPMARGKKG